MGPIDCRGKMVNNVLLTGGTTQIQGFEARFIQEFHAAMDLPKYRSLKPLQHRFRLLDCKFPANIRMFVGASIYGARRSFGTGSGAARTSGSRFRSKFGQKSGSGSGSRLSGHLKTSSAEKRPSMDIKVTAPDSKTDEDSDLNT